MARKNLTVFGILTLVAVAILISVARPTSGFNPTGALWLARNSGGARETIAFDVTSQRARFVLPSGLRSADGSAYWSAFRAGGMTALHSFDLANGSIRASFALEGDWELGALSASGKYLAVKRVASETAQSVWTKANTWHTTVALIDTQTLKTTRTIPLDGNFDVDALKADGSALYLIQHLPAVKPDHYQVRLYNLALGQLQEGALVDKRNIDEVMAGYPSDAVPSPDGRWLFTLYVGMTEGHAFIHALNLQDAYAWCIDLPSGNGDKVTLEQYTLALAPDGHTIYASNPALGTLAMADVDNIGEPRVVQFAPAQEQDAPLHTMVVSPDGKRVFFASSRTLWQYDVTANQVQDLKHSTLPIIGLTWNTEQNKLLLAYADHSLSSLPAVSANAQNKTACPVTAPSQLFVPPPAYPARPAGGDFWYGTAKLWTSLRPDGKWSALPYSEAGYTQKLAWWTNGYDGTRDPEPALTVNGRRLDSPAPPLVSSRASNAYSSDFGGWAMMVGLEIPTSGCWEITGEYAGEKLSFVVELTP